LAKRGKRGPNGVEEENEFEQLKTAMHITTAIKR